MHTEPNYGASAFDPSTWGRRRALKLIGGAGLVALVAAACGSDDATSDATAPSTTTDSTSASAAAAAGTSTTVAGARCTEIPEETSGPFPGDGSNGPDVLSESGVVRSNIATSFGSSSGAAKGVPLALDLTVLDLANGCVPFSGAAVYVWHCDRDGGYSMYSGLEDQNYLRGVQAADASGKAAFASIFPGAYSGRWPHIHFEVYPSVDAATSGGSKLATSQLALPREACEVVYAADGYEQSESNLAQSSLDRDMVFSDGYSAQLATVTGSVANGYTVSLTIAV